MTWVLTKKAHETYNSCFEAFFIWAAIKKSQEIKLGSKIWHTGKSCHLFQSCLQSFKMYHIIHPLMFKLALKMLINITLCFYLLTTGWIEKALGQDSACVCRSVCSMLATQSHHIFIPLLSLLPGRQKLLHLKKKSVHQFISLCFFVYWESNMSLFFDTCSIFEDTYVIVVFQIELKNMPNPVPKI